MEDRRKRLIVRAWRRGFREIDLILGGFADAHAETLTDAELVAFEALLEAPDQDVYDWIVGLARPPERHVGPVLARLQSRARAGTSLS